MMLLIEAVRATMEDVGRDAKNVQDEAGRRMYACVADCFRMFLQRLQTPDKVTSTEGAPTPVVTGNKAIDDVLKFFKWEHLPEDLQVVSKKFAKLAYEVAEGPGNAETTVALRKLMEAKDAAVRAVIVTK